MKLNRTGKALVLITLVLASSILYFGTSTVLAKQSKPVPKQKSGQKKPPTRPQGGPKYRLDMGHPLPINLFVPSSANPGESFAGTVTVGDYGYKEPNVVSMLISFDSGSGTFIDSDGTQTPISNSPGQTTKITVHIPAGSHTATFHIQPGGMFSDSVNFYADPDNTDSNSFTWEVTPVTMTPH
jgi:hypothetical protein